MTSISIGEAIPQLLTSFPNQNNKTIDYVILYERLEENIDENLGKKEIVQKAFFNNLASQGFEIYELEKRLEGKTIVYALLNCNSMDRLLEEAELVRLYLKLKNVINFYSINLINRPALDSTR